MQLQQRAAADARVDPRVREAFNEFDWNRDGHMDASELSRALQKLGVSADRQQTEVVLAKYDVDRSGAIELAEFAKLVADLSDYYNASARQQAERAEEARRTELEKQKAAAAAAAARRAELAAVPPEVRGAFERCDLDGSGAIDALELHRAFK